MSGLQTTAAPGSQDAIDLQTALGYLQNGSSIAAGGLGTAAAQGNITINVNHNGIDGTNVNPNDGQIIVQWDPNLAHQFSDNSIQSPAEALAHEVLGHGITPGGQDTTPDSQYGTEAERAAVGEESDIAHQLGEPTRNDHSALDISANGDVTAHTPTAADAPAVPGGNPQQDPPGVDSSLTGNPDDPPSDAESVQAGYGYEPSGAGGDDGGGDDGGGDDGGGDDGGGDDGGGGGGGGGGGDDPIGGGDGGGEEDDSVKGGRAEASSSAIRADATHVSSTHHAAVRHDAAQSALDAALKRVPEHDSAALNDHDVNYSYNLGHLLDGVEEHVSPSQGPTMLLSMHDQESLLGYYLEHNIV